MCLASQPRQDGATYGLVAGQAAFVNGDTLNLALLRQTIFAHGMVH